MATTAETGAYQFPERADRHVYRHLRARQLQEGGPSERRDHDRLQRRDRPEAGARADDRRSHGLRRIAGRRHQEDDDRRDVHGGRPREHSDRARSLADHQHDARRRRAASTSAGRRRASRSALGRAAPTASVQWNLEGGSITDLSSNSSPSTSTSTRSSRSRSTTGGGDVSVQSSGLSINLVTKSGSNVFKGTAQRHVRERRDAGAERHEGAVRRRRRRLPLGQPALRRSPSTRSRRAARSSRTGCGSGAPLDKQDINAGVLNFFDAAKGSLLRRPRSPRRRAALLDSAISLRQARAGQKCLSNDKTIIKDLQWKFNYQLNRANKFQYLFQSDNKFRNRRGASSTTQPEATTRQSSADAVEPAAADALDHAHADRVATSWCSTTSSPTSTAGSSSTTRTSISAAPALHRERQVLRLRQLATRASAELPLEHPVADQPHHELQQPFAAEHLSDRRGKPGRPSPTAPTS